MDEVEEAAKEIFERHAASVPSMDSSSLYLSDLDLYLSAIDAFFDCPCFSCPNFVSMNFFNTLFLTKRSCLRKSVFVYSCVSVSG